MGREESGHVQEVRLLKEEGAGLGVRIADQENDDGFTQVSIDEVLRGGPAHMDGRLQKGGWELTPPATLALSLAVKEAGIKE